MPPELQQRVHEEVKLTKQRSGYPSTRRCSSPETASSFPSTRPTSGRSGTGAPMRVRPGKRGALREMPGELVAEAVNLE